MIPTDLEKLRDEEIERHRIRRELLKQDATWWRFFNTGFGLWLLSSVLVGGLTVAVTTYSHRMARQRDAQQSLPGIDREVGYRIGVLKGQMAEYLENLTASEAAKEKPAGYYGGLQRRFLLADRPAYSLSAEWHDVGLIQLLEAKRIALRNSGELSDVLDREITEALEHWRLITDICIKDYHDFKSNGVSDDGYYGQMKDYQREIMSRLSQRPLASWIR